MHNASMMQAAFWASQAAFSIFGHFWASTQAVQNRSQAAFWLIQAAFWPVQAVPSRVRGRACFFFQKNRGSERRVDGLPVRCYVATPRNANRLKPACPKSGCA